MIANIRGEVISKGEDHIVIDVGGVGLRVFVPKALSEQTPLGEKLFLHTHLVVREDVLALYGFETAEVLTLFEMLLGVNGVGPRIALAIVSTLSPDVIRRGVFHEQADVFSRVPGVGKKTAQKILLYLQDRIGKEVPIGPGIDLTDVDTEVLTALTGLGYSVVEAQAALQSIPRDASRDVETRLRLALRYFST